MKIGQIEILLRVIFTKICVWQENHKAQYSSPGIRNNRTSWLLLGLKWEEGVVTRTHRDRGCSQEPEKPMPWPHSPTPPPPSPPCQSSLLAEHTQKSAGKGACWCRPVGHPPHHLPQHHPKRRADQRKKEEKEAIRRYPEEPWQNVWLNSEGIGKPLERSKQGSTLD